MRESRHARAKQTEEEAAASRQKKRQQQADRRRGSRKVRESDSRWLRRSRDGGGMVV
jgi:hypothetical protein